MPPKVKITKQEIIEAALKIVREQGDIALNARSIANMLCCSTQPIFSNFVNMEQLRFEIINRAERVYEQYVKQETQSGDYPEYKAMGIAYIRFAKEEKNLFKLLFMRDRTNEEAVDDTRLTRQAYDVVQKNTGVNSDIARLFHLEMWSYTHGIAAMLATGYLDLDFELISKMLTDFYTALKRQYEKE